MFLDRNVQVPAFGCSEVVVEAEGAIQNSLVVEVKGMKVPIRRFLVRRLHREGLMNSAAHGPYKVRMTERDEGRLETEGWQNDWQEWLAGMAGRMRLVMHVHMHVQVRRISI
jgi:hypothetical protein